MATNRHGLYAVLFDAVAIRTTDVALGLGVEAAGEGSSGEIYDRDYSINAQNLGLTFQTPAIADCIDELSSAPYHRSIAGLAAGFSAFAEKRAAGGTRAGATSHRKYNFVAGIVVPQSLTVEHQGTASLTCAATIIWNGVADPVVITESVSLPALSAVERFGLGNVTVGGVTIDTVRSVNIDFGVTLLVDGGDGDVWPSHVSIDSMTPTVTITSRDVEAFKAANIPLIGKAAAHADTKIYLRKRAQAGADTRGGGYLPDATAAHVLITADGLAYIDNALGTSGRAPGEVSLMIRGEFDGTNTPIKVNTASVNV